ncbi:MAG: hypothetical protein HN595_01470 [Flavobacteriaceae bacterium]|nr:hypothetical protein [Flavobacteriaceae bacterium]
MSNDYLKSHVINEVNNLKNNYNSHLKQRGLNAEKALKCVNCFVCMDTRKLWAWRRDGFSTSFFSNHKYDIIKCNGCSDGSDIKTSNSHSGYQKNKIEDIDGRINDLITVYETKIKEDEERVRKELEKKEREKFARIEKHQQEIESRTFSVWGKGGYNYIVQEMKEKAIDIDVGMIANKIYEAVKAYHGDFGALANLAKNLTFQLKTSISREKETKEVFDKTEPDQFGNSKYIVIKMEKLEDIKTVSSLKFFTKEKKVSSLKATYLILTPQNSKARLECDKFINHEVKHIIDKMKKHIVS